VVEAAGESWEAYTSLYASQLPSPEGGILQI